MFRMYGQIVQVLHYQSTSIELHPTEDGKMKEVETTHYAPTEEEAAALGKNVTQLPPSEDEWMDGLEIPTYNEALKVLAMGKETYEAKQKIEAQQTREALHSASIDIMQMIVDQEMRLSMLELGIQ